MVTDKNGFAIPVFVPETGMTMPLGINNFEKNAVVKLGNDVIITVGGVAVNYLEGDVIGIMKKIDYDLSTATTVHIMS